MTGKKIGDGAGDGAADGSGHGSGNGLEIRLTKREQQVLEDLARGLSAKEIAGKLHVAPKTVEVYVDRLRMKTNSRNRCHMIALAISAGLIHGAGKV